MKLCALTAIYLSIYELITKTTNNGFLFCMEFKKASTVQTAVVVNLGEVPEPILQKPNPFHLNGVCKIEFTSL